MVGGGTCARVVVDTRSRSSKQAKKSTEEVVWLLRKDCIVQ